MKIRMKAVSWMLGISLLSAMALPFSSVASQREEEPQAMTQLTLKYEHPGMEFQLYRAAEEDGRLTEGFREVDLGEAGYLPKHENNSDMQKLTIALYEYVNREEMPPDHTGRMGEEEEEITLSGLEPGFYLVTGSSLTIGDTVHMPNPFLVELRRGENRFCDIKSDHFPVNPTDPTDPTNPTSPGGTSSGGGGGSSSSGGGGGSPATTTIGEGETPLISFTNPPDELLTLEEPLVPLADLPMIPKLGDMGAAGYLYGMIASLCLLAVSLIFRQVLRPGEEG